MRTKLIILIWLILLASVSYLNAQLPQTGAGLGKAGGTAAGCNGTIDLSTGCVQPMLGVL